MTNEELHEETLAIARNLIEKNPSLKDWVTTKFPELAESDDEKIRKEIINYFSNKVSTSDETELLFFKRWITWLEKQGEQMLSNFNNIDKASLEYADNMPADGEVTHDNITEPYWNFHSIAKAFKDGFLRQNPVEWSEEDENELDRVIYMMEQLDLTNPWSDCYNWLKSIKYKAIPQPQPKWQVPTLQQLEAIRVAATVGTANNSWAMDKLKEMYKQLTDDNLV